MPPFTQFNRLVVSMARPNDSHTSLQVPHCILRSLVSGSFIVTVIWAERRYVEEKARSAR